ncbi:MAG: isocitrate lyase/phosphoenolpyruvate mutase family protein [Chloroflexi bacterium]|nr:isocitrate lyase/phosphoenolpyruvate mutase family protein [Chloroflexota bacterium]
MHWTPRRERFRALLSGDHCVHPASVHDAVAARIAEDLGFEVGMFAGSVASLAVLGAPDLIVLTLSEFAQQAYRINRAGNLPLLVDADHGYGNALNVKRTVEELETAGVAALTIEDTLLPAPFGATGKNKNQLVSLEEGVGKMKAALAGRQDPSLVIAGRTSAMQTGGLGETVKRSRAYVQVGVDAIFLVGVETREELDVLAEEIRVPIFLGRINATLSDREYLASRNVRVALQGHLPFAAIIQTLHDVLKALRNGTPPSKIQGVASDELVKRVTRDDDYKSWTRDFLS